MKKFLAACVLALGLAGCINNPLLNVDYMGQTYPPTDRVDVYFSKHNITRAYNVMGRIELDASDFAGPGALEQAIRQQAALRGADAVIVTGFSRKPEGSTVFYDYNGWNDFYGFGPYGPGPAMGMGMAVSTPIEEKQVEALLVKYQANAAVQQPLQPLPEIPY